MHPSSPPPIPLSKDEEHLNRLSTFHYVMTGILVLTGFLPLAYVPIGLSIMSSTSRSNAPMGGILAAIFILAALMTWATAIFTLMSGRYLATRRKRMFSVVIAALLCTIGPFGTILGIFTLIVLNRDSVRNLYESQLK